MLHTVPPGMALRDTRTTMGLLGSLVIGTSTELATFPAVLAAITDARDHHVSWAAMGSLLGPSDEAAR